nr:hypothetical protein [Akkermansiaceae bacterium]
MKTFFSAKLMAFRRSLTLVVLTVVYQAAAAVPTILSFTASDSSVTPGTEVSLSWEVRDFDQILLGDVDVTGLTSVPVAPLVTTSYTLTARNQDGGASARVRVEVVDAPGLIGAAGRYVEVVKNDPNNTQLHLSEIEVFEFGATPDQSLLSGLSSNNLVRSGTPSVQAPPTTTELDHGIPERVFNGGLERGTGIWTTRNGLGEKARYMLDLGASQSIGTVRLFGRADTCCLDRLENVTVNVYADGGDDTPGKLISSATFPGTAPTGNAGHIELDLSILDPGIREFATGQVRIAPGDPVTLEWEVNKTTTRVMIDQGVGDVTARTGPATRPGGTSVASLLVLVTDQPQIFSFNAEASLVSPGAEVRLSWAVGNVTSVALNGQDVTVVDGITVTPESTTAY